MPKDPTKTRSGRVLNNPHSDLKEEIPRRAYELYEERGREDGHDVDDWLRAEAEIADIAPKNSAA